MDELNRRIRCGAMLTVTIVNGKVHADIDGVFHQADTLKDALLALELYCASLRDSSN